MDYDHANWDRAYSDIIKKTWFVKICYADDDEDHYGGGSGFSLFEPRLVCTCAHVVKEAYENNYLILGYHLGDENISTRSLQIVFYKPEWDVSFLWLSEGDPPEQFFKKSEYYHKLFVCHSLLHIGCGGLHGASFYKMMVANSLPTPEFLKRHRQTYERVKGDSKNERNPYKNPELPLSPFLPVIEVSGTAIASGCSGGPFVSLDGHLVGMLLGDKAGLSVSYALHYTVLLKAYKEYKKTEASSSKETEASSSKEKRKRQARKVILGGKLSRNFQMFQRRFKLSRIKERV